MSEKSRFLVFILASLCLNYVYCDDTLELTCAIHEDCKSFSDKLVSSVCRESLCACFNRKTNEMIRCSPKTKVSNFTSVSGACTGANSEDYKGKCITSVVHLGKMCDAAKQCARSDKGASCIDGLCKCVDGFVEAENACRMPVEIDADDCSEENLKQKNAKCIGGKCYCNKGFITSSKKECLPLANYNQVCEEDIQCHKGFGIDSVCQNGFCNCNATHIAYLENEEYKEFVCVEKVEEDACSEETDCGPYVDCENNKCKCSNGFQLAKMDGRKNKCIKTILPYSSAVSSSGLFYVTRHVFMLSLIVSIFFY